jgi:phage shock protein C
MENNAPATTRPPFRMHRSRTDKMLGGVAGGLAESLDIDVTLLRIAFVALTVLGGGIGIPLYVAAWIVAPEG